MVVRTLALLAACAAWAGCSRVVVESPGERSCGVKYFPVSRPVLLVTKTDPCGRPVAVQVTYLPDLTRPRYVEPHPGFGSAGFDLTCDRGIATTFEVTSADPRFPEILQAMGNAAVSYIAGKELLEQLEIVEKSE